MEMIDDLKSLLNRVDHTTRRPAQMLNSLLSFISLTLTCRCTRKALFCRLFFAGKEPTVLHHLYHLTAICISHMNWLFIVYGQDYGAAFNEIFLLLPQILGKDSSVSLAWSVMATESKIWELERVLIGESISVDLSCMFVEELLQQVHVVQLFRFLAETRKKITAPVGSQLVIEQQSSSVAGYSVVCYLAKNGYSSESISNKPGS